MGMICIIMIIKLVIIVSDSFIGIGIYWAKSRSSYLFVNPNDEMLNHISLVGCLVNDIVSTITRNIFFYKISSLLLLRSLTNNL